MGLKKNEMNLMVGIAVTNCGAVHETLNPEVVCTEDHLAGLHNREGGGVKMGSLSSNHF